VPLQPPDDDYDYDDDGLVFLEDDPDERQVRAAAAAPGRGSWPGRARLPPGA
jgi:hypothetical protein